MAITVNFGVNPREMAKLPEGTRVLSISSIYYRRVSAMYGRLRELLDGLNVPFVCVDADINVSNEVEAHEQNKGTAAPQSFRVAVTGDVTAVMPLLNQMVRQCGLSGIAAKWDCGNRKALEGKDYIVRIPVVSNNIAHVMEAYEAAFTCDLYKGDPEYAQLADYLCDGFGDTRTTRPCAVSEWLIDDGYLWLRMPVHGATIVGTKDATIEQLFDVVNAALMVKSAGMCNATLLVKLAGMRNSMPTYADQYTKSTFATVGDRAPKIQVGGETNVMLEENCAEAEDVPQVVADAYALLRDIVDYPSSFRCFVKGLQLGHSVLDAMETPDADGIRRNACSRARKNVMTYKDIDYINSGALYDALHKKGAVSCSRVDFRRKCFGGSGAQELIHA